MGFDPQGIMRHMPDMVCVTEFDGRIKYINPAWERVLGLSSRKLLAKDIGEIIHPDDLELTVGAFDTLASGDQNASFENRCQRVDGTYKWFWWRSRVNRGHSLIYSVVTDITDRKKNEKKLTKLANVDDLTKVFNRRYFIGKLKEEIERAKRYGHALSVMLIDADHFKRVNDRYGHDVGDQALKVLSSIGRKTFRGVDVFCRLGGEEFAVLLPETDLEKVGIAADRFRMAVERTAINTEQGTLHITISIGITTATKKRSLTVTNLMKRADTTLYIAKNNGRNRVEIDCDIPLHINIVDKEVA